MRSNSQSASSIPHLNKAHWEALGPLIGFFSKRGFDEEDAHDLAFDTIVRTIGLQHKNGVEAKDFRRYLFGVAKRVVMEALRKKHWENFNKISITGFEDLLEAPIPVEDEERPEQRYTSINANTLIKQLPEAERTLLKKYFLKQQSSKELARQLGISKASVRIRVFRLRVSLRKKLLALKGKQSPGKIPE